MTGEHLSPDIRELLKLFSRHRVRYLLIGGEAVIHYGYARLTGDVDFFYDRSPSNVARLYAALRDFWGGDVPAISGEEDLLEAGVVIQFGRPPNRIDLISSLGSISFDAAWRRRTVERLRLRRRVVPLPIISLADLLVSKREAGRHKDLDDVDHLLRVTAGKTRRRKKP